MNFKVITSSKLDTFEYWINEYIKTGWFLHGNFIVENGVFYQAVFKPYVSHDN